MPSGVYVRTAEDTARRRASPKSRGWFNRVEKECCACKTVKPVSEFRPYGRGYDFFKSHCIPCERARARAYWEANKEKVKARQAEYRASNIERRRKMVRENLARYRKEDPVHFRKARAVSNAKRRKAAVGAGFSQADIDALGNYQAWCCAACFSDIATTYQVDHIWPLALGGLNDAENIQLLCKTCNRSKGKKTPLAFMIQRVKYEKHMAR